MPSAILYMGWHSQDDTVKIGAKVATSLLLFIVLLFLFVVHGALMKLLKECELPTPERSERGTPEAGQLTQSL